MSERPTLTSVKSITESGTHPLSLALSLDMREPAPADLRSHDLCRACITASLAGYCLASCLAFANACRLDWQNVEVGYR